MLTEHVIDVDESTFEAEVILRSHEVPVLVDFWAPWCAPCKSLEPILERLAIEKGGSFIVARVNVDENPSLALRHGVQGIPAVKAFRGGQIVAQFVGFQPEPVVRRMVERVVPSEAERAVESARSLLATRHWPEAERAFREVYEQDETNAPAALGLLETLLWLGRGQEALRILATFPAGTEWATAERLKPLANLLAEVEGNGPAGDDPLAAQLYQAGRLIARSNMAAAMDGLLDILRQDKHYRGGMPKDIMLGLFVLMGEGDALTRQYRDELASVLF